jgi:hypothetical protein
MVLIGHGLAIAPGRDEGLGREATQRRLKKHRIAANAIAAHHVASRVDIEVHLATTRQLRFSGGARPATGVRAETAGKLRFNLGARG